jgi:hypothetical protein
MMATCYNMGFMMLIKQVIKTHIIQLLDFALC